MLVRAKSSGFLRAKSSAILAATQSKTGLGGVYMSPWPIMRDLDSITGFNDRPIKTEKKDDEPTGVDKKYDADDDKRKGPLKKEPEPLEEPFAQKGLKTGKKDDAISKKPEAEDKEYVTDDDKRKRPLKKEPEPVKEPFEQPIKKGDGGLTVGEAVDMPTNGKDYVKDDDKHKPSRKESTPSKEQLPKPITNGKKDDYIIKPKAIGYPEVDARRPFKKDTGVTVDKAKVTDKEKVPKLKKGVADSIDVSLSDTEKDKDQEKTRKGLRRPEKPMKEIKDKEKIELDRTLDAEEKVEQELLYDEVDQPMTRPSVKIKEPTLTESETQILDVPSGRTVDDKLPAKMIRKEKKELERPEERVKELKDKEKEELDRPPDAKKKFKREPFEDAVNQPVTRRSEKIQDIMLTESGTKYFYVPRGRTVDDKLPEKKELERPKERIKELKDKEKEKLDRPPGAEKKFERELFEDAVDQPVTRPSEKIKKPTFTEAGTQTSDVLLRPTVDAKLPEKIISKTIKELERPEERIKELKDKEKEKLDRPPDAEKKFERELFEDAVDQPVTRPSEKIKEPTFTEAETQTLDVPRRRTVDDKLSEKMISKTKKELERPEERIKELKDKEKEKLDRPPDAEKKFEQELSEDAVDQPVTRPTEKIKELTLTEAGTPTLDVSRRRTVDDKLPEKMISKTKKELERPEERIKELKDKEKEKLDRSPDAEKKFKRELFEDAVDQPVTRPSEKIKEPTLTEAETQTSDVSCRQTVDEKMIIKTTKELEPPEERIKELKDKEKEKLDRPPDVEKKFERELFEGAVDQPVTRPSEKIKEPTLTEAGKQTLDEPSRRAVDEKLPAISKIKKELEHPEELIEELKDKEKEKLGRPPDAEKKFEQELFEDAVDQPVTRPTEKIKELTLTEAATPTLDVFRRPTVDDKLPEKMISKTKKELERPAERIKELKDKEKEKLDRPPDAEEKFERDLFEGAVDQPVTRPSEKIKEPTLTEAGKQTLDEPSRRAVDEKLPAISKIKKELERPEELIKELKDKEKEKLSRSPDAEKKFKRELLDQPVTRPSEKVKEPMFTESETQILDVSSSRTVDDKFPVKMISKTKKELERPEELIEELKDKEKEKLGKPPDAEKEFKQELLEVEVDQPVTRPSERIREPTLTEAGTQIWDEPSRRAVDDKLPAISKIKKELERPEELIEELKDKETEKLGKPLDAEKKFKQELLEDAVDQPVTRPSEKIKEPMLTESGTQILDVPSRRTVDDKLPAKIISETKKELERPEELPGAEKKFERELFEDAVDQPVTRPSERIKEPTLTEAGTQTLDEPSRRAVDDKLPAISKIKKELERPEELIEELKDKEKEKLGKPPDAEKKFKQKLLEDSVDQPVTRPSEKMEEPMLTESGTQILDVPSRRTVDDKLPAKIISETKKKLERPEELPSAEKKFERELFEDAVDQPVTRPSERIKEPTLTEAGTQTLDEPSRQAVDDKLSAISKIKKELKRPEELIEEPKDKEKEKLGKPLDAEKKFKQELLEDAVDQPVTRPSEKIKEPMLTESGTQILDVPSRRTVDDKLPAKIISETKKKLERPEELPSAEKKFERELFEDAVDQPVTRPSERIKEPTLIEAGTQTLDEPSRRAVDDKLPAISKIKKELERPEELIEELKDKEKEKLGRPPDAEEKFKRVLFEDEVEKPVTRPSEKIEEPILTESGTQILDVPIRRAVDDQLPAKLISKAKDLKETAPEVVKDREVLESISAPDVLQGEGLEEGVPDTSKIMEQIPDSVSTPEKLRKDIEEIVQPRKGVLEEAGPVSAGIPVASEKGLDKEARLIYPEISEDIEKGEPEYAKLPEAFKKGLDKYRLKEQKETLGPVEEEQAGVLEKIEEPDIPLAFGRRMGECKARCNLVPMKRKPAEVILSTTESKYLTADKHDEKQKVSEIVLVDISKENEMKTITLDLEQDVKKYKPEPGVLKETRGPGISKDFVRPMVECRARCNLFPIKQVPTEIMSSKTELEYLSTDEDDKWQDVPEIGIMEISEEKEVKEMTLDITLQDANISSESKYYRASQKSVVLSDQAKNIIPTKISGTQFSPAQQPILNKISDLQKDRFLLVVKDEATETKRADHRCIAACRNAKERPTVFGEETGGIILGIDTDTPHDLVPPGYYLPDDMTPRKLIPEWADISKTPISQGSFTFSESTVPTTSEADKVFWIVPEPEEQILEAPKDKSILKLEQEWETDTETFADEDQGRLDISDEIPMRNVMVRAMSGEVIGIPVTTSLMERTSPQTLSQAIYQQKLSLKRCKARCANKKIDAFALEEEALETAEDVSDINTDSEIAEEFYDFDVTDTEKLTMTEATGNLQLSQAVADEFSKENKSDKKALWPKETLVTANLQTNEFNKNAKTEQLTTDKSDDEFQDATDIDNIKRPKMLSDLTETFEVEQITAPIENTEYCANKNNYNEVKQDNEIVITPQKTSELKVDFEDQILENEISADDLEEVAAPIRDYLFASEIRNVSTEERPRRESKEEFSDFHTAESTEYEVTNEDYKDEVEKGNKKFLTQEEAKELKVSVREEEFLDVHSRPLINAEGVQTDPPIIYIPTEVKGKLGEMSVQTIEKENFSRYVEAIEKMPLPKQEKATPRFANWFSTAKVSKSNRAKSVCPARCTQSSSTETKTADKSFNLKQSTSTFGTSTEPSRPLVCTEQCMRSTTTETVTKTADKSFNLKQSTSTFGTSTEPPRPLVCTAQCMRSTTTETVTKTADKSFNLKQSTSTFGTSTEPSRPLVCTAQCMRSTTTETVTKTADKSFNLKQSTSTFGTSTEPSRPLVCTAQCMRSTTTETVTKTADKSLNLKQFTSTFGTSTEPSRPLVCTAQCMRSTTTETVTKTADESLNLMQFTSSFGTSTEPSKPQAKFVCTARCMRSSSTETFIKMADKSINLKPSTSRFLTSTEPEYSQTQKCTSTLTESSLTLEQCLRRLTTPPEKKCHARCARISNNEDEQIQLLIDDLTAKEAYCAEQRKIATAALEQLENIKNIVEERDDLRKKLQTSQYELEDLKKNLETLGYGDVKSINKKKSDVYVPFTVSDSSLVNSGEEEIKLLEDEIKKMRTSGLTPDQETKVIKKEVEVLKHYCSKLSSIQEENSSLKKCNTDLQRRCLESEQKLEALGCDDKATFEDIQEKLLTLNETVAERDVLQNRVGQLEKELAAYRDLPEDIEVFKRRSILLDDVLKDRDRLAKRVEQMRGIDDEIVSFKLKAERVDELERQLRLATKDIQTAEDELDSLRNKCMIAEIELLNQKTEADTLRSKIICMEHEMESLKSVCKEQEILQIEKERLQSSLDELVRMQDDYEHMCVQMKALDILKAERDRYKRKYEDLVGLESECNLLRKQLDNAKIIEREKDALERQAEDLEKCICEQEDEIRRLVCHIDCLAQGKEEQQHKMKQVVSNFKTELEKKESLLILSEEKITTMKGKIDSSFHNLSEETKNLRQENKTLEKKINVLTSDNSDLQQKLNRTVDKNADLVKELKNKNRIIETMQEVLKDRETCQADYETIVCNSHEIARLQNELEAAKLDNHRLQELASQTGNKNQETNQQLRDMLDQSRTAVERIALELEQQYADSDNKKRFRCCPGCNCKRKSKDVEPKIIYRCCAGCTCKKKTKNTNNNETEGSCCCSRQAKSADSSPMRCFCKTKIRKQPDISPRDHSCQCIEKKEAMVNTISEVKCNCKNTKNAGTHSLEKSKPSDSKFIVTNVEAWDFIQATPEIEDELDEDQMYTARSFEGSKAKIAELEHELLITNNTIIELREKIAANERLAAENSALRKHFTELQEVARAQIEELANHLKQAKNRIGEVEARNCKLEFDLCKYQKQLRLLGIHRESSDTEQITDSNMVSKLQVDFKGSIKLRDNFKNQAQETADNQIENLADHLKKAKDRIAEVEATNCKLKFDLHICQKQLRELDIQKESLNTRQMLDLNTVAQLQADLEECLKEKEMLLKLIENLKIRDQEEAKDKIENLVNHLKKANYRIGEVEATNCKLKFDLYRSQKQLRELDIQKESLGNKGISDLNTTAKLQADLEECLKEKEMLLKLIENLKIRDQEEAKDKIENLVNHLKKANDRIGEVETTNCKLKFDLHRSQKQLRELDIQKESLGNKGMSDLNTTAKLQADLEECLKEKEMLLKLIENLKTKDQEETKDQNEDLLNHLKKAKEKIGEIEEINCKLKCDLHKCKKQLHELGIQKENSDTEEIPDLSTLHKIQVDLAECLKEKEKLLKLVENLNQQLAESQELLTATQPESEELLNLKNDLEACLKEKGTLSKIIQNLQDQLASGIERIEDPKRQLEATKKTCPANMCCLKKALTKCLKEKEDLVKIIDSLQNQLASVTTEELPDLAAFVQIKAELENCVKEKQNLLKQISDLKEQLASSKMPDQQTIDYLKDEPQKCLNEKEALLKTIDGLQKQLEDCISEKQNLLKQLSDLKESLASSKLPDQQTLDDLKDKLEKCIKEKEDLLNMIKSLQNQLSSGTSENLPDMATFAKLRAELEDCLKEKENLLKQIGDVKQQLATSKIPDLDDLRDKLEKCLKEKEALQEMIANLQSQLASGNIEELPDMAAFARLKAEQEDCLKEKENLLKQITDLKQQLATSKIPDQPTIDDLRDKLEKCLKEKEALQEMIANLQSQLASGNIEELPDMAAFARLKAQLEDCLKEKENLLKQIPDLKQQLATSKIPDQPTIDDLRDKLEKCLKEKEALQEMIANLQSQLASGNIEELPDITEFVKLKAELEDCLNEKQSLLKQISDLKQLIASTKVPDQSTIDDDKLEKCVREKEALQKIIANLENQLASSNIEQLPDMAEFAQLKADLEECLKDKHNLTRQINDHKQQLVSDQHTIDDLKNNLEKCLKEKEALQKMIYNLQDQLASGKIEELPDIAEFASLKAKLENCLKEKENLLTEISQSKDRHDAFLRVKSELEDCLKEKIDLLKQIDELKQQIDSRPDMTTFTKLKSDLERCLKDKGEFLELTNKLKDENNKLRNEKDGLDKMLMSNVVVTSKRSSKLENELDTIANQNKNLIAENEKLHQVNKNLENQNRELQQQLTALQNENDRLKMELGKLKENQVKIQTETDNIKKSAIDPSILDALRKENKNLQRQLESQKIEMNELLEKFKQPSIISPLHKSVLENDQKDKDAMQAIITDLENQLKNLMTKEKIRSPEPSDDLRKKLDELAKQLDEAQRRAEAAEQALRNMKVSDPTAMLNAEMQKLRERLSQLEKENSSLKDLLTHANNDKAALKKDLDSALNDAKKIKEENKALQKITDDLKKDKNNLEINLQKIKDNAFGDSELKAENDKLNKRIAQLESEVANLKKELDHSYTEAKKSVERVNQLVNENGDLRKKLAQLEGENLKLKKETEAALADAKKTADKLLELEKENSKCKQTVKDLENEVARLKKELDSMLNEAKKNANIVSDLQKEIAGLKQIVAQLEAINAKLDGENSKVKKELEQARGGSRAVTVLQDENKKLKQQNTAIQSEIDNLKKELENALADAKSKLLTATQLQDEMGKLKKRMLQLEAENDDLKRKLATALGDSKRTDLQEAYDKLRQKLADIENENSKLKKDLQIALEDGKKIRDELNELKEREKKSKEKIAQLESDNGTLKRKLDSTLDEFKKLGLEMAGMQGDESKLKQKIAILEAENLKLKKDLEAALENARKASADASASKDENSKLKQRIAQLESENTKLKTDMDLTLSQLKKLSDQGKLLQDENNKYKQKIGQLEDETGKLKQKLDTALKQAKPTSAPDDNLKKRLEDEVDRLKKELNETKNEARDNGKELSQLNDDNNRLKQKINQLEAENGKLKKDLENAVKAAKNTENELSHLKGDNLKLRDQIKQLNNDISMLQKEKAALAGDINKAESDLTKLSELRDSENKLKQRIAQLESENAKLKKDLDAALRDSKRLADDLSKATNENAKIKKELAKIEDENKTLKKEFDKAITDARKGAEIVGDLKEVEKKLKDRITQLETENARLKFELEDALNSDKKAATDLSKLRDDDNKLKRKLGQLEVENIKQKKDSEKALTDAQSNVGQAAELLNENNKLKQKTSQLESEVGNLRKELEAALNDAKNKATGMSKLQDEINNLKQKNAKLEKENDNLKKELDAALRDQKAESNSGKKLRDENLKQKQKIAQLEDELARLKKELEAEKSAKTAAPVSVKSPVDKDKKEQLEQLGNENVKLKKDLENALKNAQKLNGLQDENTKLKQQVSKLKADIDKLKNDLNTSINEAKKVAGELANLKENKSKLTQRIAHLETENIKLKNDLDDFKSKAEEANSLRNENKKLREQVKQLNDEIYKLKSALTAAESKTMPVDATQGLKDELAKLKQRIANLETENVKLKQQYDEAKTELQSAKAADKISADVNNSKKQLQDAKTANQTLSDENGNLRKKVEQLNQEFAKIKKDFEGAKAANKTLADENVKLKKKIEQLEQERSKMKKELQDAKTANQILADESGKLKKKIAQLEEEIVKLKKELGDLGNLKDENMKLKGENEKLQNDFKASKDQLNNALQKLATLGGKDFEKQIKEYESKIKQLEAELTKQKKECDDNIKLLKDQFNRDMKNLLQKHDDNIEKLQREHADTIKKLNEEHDKEMKSLRDAFKQIRAELEAALTEKDNLKSLLEDQKRKSIEIKEKVEQVEKIISKERKRSVQHKKLSKMFEENIIMEKKKSLEIQKERDNLSEKLDQLVKTKKQAEQETDIVKAEKEALAREKEKLKLESDELRRDSLILQKTVEIEKSKSKDLESDLKSLQRKLITIPEEEVTPTTQRKQKSDKLTMATFETVSLAPDVIPITTPLSDKELKFYGKEPCPCGHNLDELLKKAVKYGLQGLSIEELQLMHKHLSEAAANILERMGKKTGVLRPAEGGDRLSLLRRIAELEGELMRKQKHTQQKIAEMQNAVKLEKERLSELRKKLEMEKKPDKSTARDAPRRRISRDVEALEVMKNQLEQRLNEELLHKMRLEKKLNKRPRSRRESPARDSLGSNGTQ